MSQVCQGCRKCSCGAYLGATSRARLNWQLARECLELVPKLVEPLGDPGARGPELAGWLDRVLEDEQRKQDELDIREDAVWEGTPEGNAAINREKKKILEGLAPKNVTKAGWES